MRGTIGRAATDSYISERYVWSRPMARRRKAGRRTKSGRFSRAADAIPVDRGTAGGQRNRSFLINGAAPEMVGSTLTILLANTQITPEQARAGNR
jgi:hypothetical protein